MKQLYDAFISYGRADSKAFALKLNEKLLERGLNVWFDQEDIPLAVDFQEQINSGIEHSHNFIFIIAPHSINSEYCLKEINQAIQYNKRIIPLLHVEQITYETWQLRNPHQTQDDWQGYQAQGRHSSFPNMHPTISKLNWVYCRENIDNFATSFEGIITALSQHQNYVANHTKFLVKALDWLRNQKQTNYLLIGEARQEAEKWLKHRFVEEQQPCVPTDLHCEFISESVKNANNLMTQVFLSASDKDNLIREKIGKTLMREGFTIWTNQTDIKTGTNFEKAIKKGIERADNFIYFISPDTLASQSCYQEFVYAFGNNKRIIPLLVQETSLDLIPAELQELQFIDLTASEDENKYLLGITNLLKALKSDAHYYESHKVLLVKALKWQQQNRNPSILLRSYNLKHFEAWLKLAKQRPDYPPLPLQEEFINQSLQKPKDYSLEVFISYSRADSDFARKLNEALIEVGKLTWFDQESIASGADFQQEIYRGIESSDNFLFIISPHSVNSPYCADEVEYARSLNKRFVTVVYRPVKTEKLHSELAKIQWIDFNQHDEDFNANFPELVRTIDTDREHVHNHTKWSQRAREWKQRDKTVDLLLRGSELSMADNWLQATESNNKQPPATELQKEFIGSSSDLCDRIKQAEENRRRRDIKTAWGIAVGSLLAVIISTGLWLKAGYEQRQAELHLGDSLARYSLSLFAKGKELDAFVKAIQAGKIMQKYQVSNPDVISALQKVLYQGSVKNSFQGHDNSVRSVSFSPDGQVLATGSADKTIKLWNLKTGEEIRTLQGHDKWVNSVSFSSDGQILATGSGDKTIKLWNVETGEEIHTLLGHGDAVNSVSFSPNDQILASGSEDKTIKLWHLETGQEIKTLQGHNDSVRSVSFSPDSQILASGSEDKTIKLWHLETGQEINTLQGHDKRINSVSFSPDSQTLATASWDKTIKLWNVETGQEIRTLVGHDNWVNSISFSPDGQTLVSGSWDKTIKLWDLETGKEIRTLPGQDDWIWSVSFSPDGRTLATSSAYETKIWNLEAGKEIRTLQGHNDEVLSVSLSPDRKILVSSSWDKTIKIWNLETGKEILTLQGHGDSVRGIAISPDSRILASASWDKTIKLWNLETGQEIRTLIDHDHWVNTIVFSPDGQTLVSGSVDKTIKLWDLETGEEIRTLIGHDHGVNSIIFSPDGRILASGSWDKTIKLWNLETGENIRTLLGHDNWVNSVSFSPDGQTLASGSGDKTIKLWNLETGENIRTIVGHDNWVNSVSFSPDGQTLVSGSGDKTIKLWNLETGEEIRTLPGHDKWVNSVSFSPDGQTVISGSSDKTIKLWNLYASWELDSLMGSSCDWVRNYLLHNPNVKDEDRKLCDGMGRTK